ncbi:hypothetical protein GCM10027445_14390 [Amycolatopsis endophytica]|uniref:Antitoxin (DNA-binding transcriptional repressor) of toxin-antitoxin stability system n=1 Tax=Amycolatopsis endophytica TaxID=860233 RepID=A0A853B4P3_9PSEU|nr:type II toxin-antitoxin system Phd/YefM family antitoxin [Amycolatopsis endophytica]NYI89576.1 antitoxin (DNA-binding transcriptional repressor) of toxin-antitoxin stability system [Amycolatopsis endophytica]
MATHGTKDYRRDMAAIHEEVVSTGEAAIITKDGKPYVKVVPVGEEDVLAELRRRGDIVWPTAVRVEVEPIHAGADDTTDVIAGSRR